MKRIFFPALAFCALAACNAGGDGVATDTSVDVNTTPMVDTVIGVDTYGGTDTSHGSAADTVITSAGSGTGAGIPGSSSGSRPLGSGGARPKGGS